ncbi:hypothetical protein A9P44_10225 [Paenibacillus polymyxa]|nr:hypothetical protein [Paenibacillus polymyxa]OBA07239.1 hypothetical protein A9P44_10225 [Paenibacillus polymyxa]
MAARIIPFPLRNKQQPTEVDPFEKALAEMENRLGVSVSDYLGFSGDPEETARIVERNMNRESLKIRTKLISVKK